MKTYSIFSTLLETLKSDEIDVVEKKLSRFFLSRGFNKETDFGDEAAEPNFMIHSDRRYLRKSLDEYRLGESPIAKQMFKMYKKEDLVRSAEKSLDNARWGDIFIFVYGFEPSLTTEFRRVVESSGYFVAKASSMDGDERAEDKSKVWDFMMEHRNLSISIEPMYDQKVGCRGKYLYHTTDRKNLEKIMRIGLVPKSKNTRSFYPERIYLSPNMKWMSAIQHQLKGDKGGEFVTLKIRNRPGCPSTETLGSKGGSIRTTSSHRRTSSS